MATTKGVIILGSARRNGNTAKVAGFLSQLSGYEVVDLNDYRIGQYDYEHLNRADDFPPLLRHLMENYEHWIFATPVYWYSMSGIMKAFCDRLTDLLDLHPLRKRALEGKSLGLLCCSSDEEEIEGFEIPFRETAGYMFMRYLGAVHTWVENDDLPTTVRGRLEEFARKLR